MRSFLTGCWLLGVILMALGSSSFAAPEERKDGPPPHHGDYRPDPDREVWNKLSEEDRQKLREALRNVWSDPAVLNAREEVSRATEAYQSAIRSAIGKSDPELGKILIRLQAESAGYHGKKLGSPRPGPPGGAGGPPMGGEFRSFDQLLRPPGFLENLTPEEREAYLKAQSAARDSEAVKEALGKLAGMRDKDEELRRMKLGLLRQVRRVMFEEMVKADPTVEEILKRYEPVWGPGKGRGEKGSEGGEKEPKRKRPEMEEEKGA